MLLLRWYLARQNKLRERERDDSLNDRPRLPHSSRPVEAAGEKEGDAGDDDKFDEVYLVDSEGIAIGKVDKAFLDLTDIENRDFRYVY